MSRLKRVAIGLLVVCGLAVIGFFLVPVPQAAVAAHRIPSVRLLDRNGVLLREVLSTEEGTSAWVPLDAISPDLVAATVAAEDHRFWSCPGVDPIGIARAAVQNARNHRVVSGASTIAMQLVANSTGDHAQTLRGKLWQALQALRLMTVLSHREVLERYLNTVPYGNQTFGVEAACRYYFNCHANQLTLAQAAYLAAIPCAPSVYDPLTHPDLVVARQHYILSQMNVAPARLTLAEQERIAPSAGRDAFLAPHFCDLALSRIQQRTGEVRTTLDLALQHDLEGMLKLYVPTLQNRNVGQAAMVVLDNASGDVLALVGSVDYEKSQVDGANSLRQPGSTLKPFTYGLAFEHGYTPASILPDLPARYESSHAHDYAPENYDLTWHGPVRARTALACSYNAPAVRLLNAVGPEALLETLHRVGFTSLRHDAPYYGLGLTLGDGEVTLLQLARAYRALARGGSYTPERIFLDQVQPEGVRIFPETITALLTSILSDPNARLPSFGPHSVLNLPFPCAAKTGTSHDYRDNWTVGYTTRYTVAVWVGNFNSEPLQDVSGVTGAGPLFRQCMLRLHEREAPQPFPTPPGLVTARICPDSGELAGPNCPSAMTEVFLSGTEPKQVCDVHQVIDGRVVTVYPAEYHAWMRSRGMKVPNVNVSSSEAGITSPTDGEVYYLDPVLRRGFQAIHLAAVPPSGHPDVTWYVDGRQHPDARLALTEGPHEIRAVSGSWSDTVHIVVH